MSRFVLILFGSVVAIGVGYMLLKTLVIVLLAILCVAPFIWYFIHRIEKKINPAHHENTSSTKQ